MLERFELTLINDSNPSDKIHTFTWGETRAAAYARTVDTIDDPTWDGWSFILADQPTKIDNEPRTSLGVASDYPNGHHVSRGAF